MVEDALRGGEDERRDARGDAQAGHMSESEQGGTGVPAVDQARERLAAVDEAPLDEHVDVYEDVHRQLQEGLADLDES
jgi:hypothetical protein